MEYYNIARSLTAAKNDCAAGVMGTSVTLTANANQFVSTISIEDANAKADAWLSANVQAYANNAGSCRATAWRGINPSCVVEPDVTLSPLTTWLLDINGHWEQEKILTLIPELLIREHP